MLFFRVLVGCFLSFIFCSYSAFATIENYFPLKHVTTSSHTYIHEILKETRSVLRPTQDPKTLAQYMKQFKVNGDVYVYPFLINVYYPLSSIVTVDMGIDGKDTAEIVSFFLQGAAKRGNKSFKKRLVDSLRGNLALVKNRAQYPIYFRLGYDYAPFGCHTSEIIRPCDMVTRSTLTQKTTVLEIGARSNANDGLKGSLAHAVNKKVTFLNIQYDRNNSHHKEIDRYIVGGGIGFSNKMEVLFNFYEHITYAKKYHARLEYLYNPILENGPKEPHLIYLESTRYLKGMTQYLKRRTQWHIPCALIAGYEGCHNSQSEASIHNVFAALKFKFFKKRFVVRLGYRWDLMEGTRENINDISVTF